MKHLLALIFAVLTATGFAQTRIDGTVFDADGPLVGVNVFLVGSLDGSITDSLGRFSFTTARSGEQTLRASLLGYEEVDVKADATSLRGLKIRLRVKAATLDEVVVTASTYSMGKSSQFKAMNALDVVLAGNSCGDVVAALQTLPGTQMVAENGRLYVRGGDSEECQTYINGMHVMVPYSTNVEGSAQRGRFSPFLFKGMSFQLGGYGAEYGQALSSVLPMETSDVGSADKLGVSASLLDWSIGGTSAFARSSLSYNVNYTDLGLHTALFPDRNDWTRPYRKASGEMQFKAEWSPRTELKTYAGYDWTSVGLRTEGRSLSMAEHNVYANAVLRSQLGRGYSLFVGMAESAVISDVYVEEGHYRTPANEVHLKADVRKSFSGTFRLQAGVEDFIRSYNLFAGYVNVQMRLAPKVFLTVSGRAELLGGEWLLMPRATLSYVPGKAFQASLMAGRYSQIPEGFCSQSTADHVILSMQYTTSGTLVRFEPYYKHYQLLPWLNSTDGYGYSRGLDVFCESSSLLSGLTVSAAYSFNDSQRLYQSYDAPRVPSFASRHNLRLTAKYAIGKVIFGLAESYASGRTYDWGTAPYYNSVDANITWLAHPKVIVYTSLSNLLGRRNYGVSRDRFFYFGIFVSLKNNKAYDISNF